MYNEALLIIYQQKWRICTQMYQLATYRKCPSHSEQPSRIASSGNRKEVKDWRRQDAGQVCSQRMIDRMSPLPFGVVTRTENTWPNSLGDNLKSPPKVLWNIRCYPWREQNTRQVHYIPDIRLWEFRWYCLCTLRSRLFACCRLKDNSLWSISSLLFGNLQGKYESGCPFLPVQ
jgi:hypothetical protein